MGKDNQKSTTEQVFGKNGYSLSRQWFDFAFENPDIVSPCHAALYLWFCELNNRLGWAKKFGAPTTRSMAAVGIKNYKTYKKAFDDLVVWGFVEIIRKSCNQYTANIISLKNAPIQNTGALDSAMVKSTKASPKHLPKQVQRTAYINKQRNLEPKKQINIMSAVFTPDYKPLNNYDSIAFKLWKQVYEKLIKKNITPTSLQKAKVKDWTDDIGLMIESDGRTDVEIVEILNFLKENDFWANNILSTSKLRQKFERLLLEARTSNKKRQSLSNHSIGNDQNLSETMDYNLPLNEA